MLPRRPLRESQKRGDVKTSAPYEGEHIQTRGLDSVRLLHFWSYWHCGFCNKVSIVPFPTMSGSKKYFCHPGPCQDLKKKYFYRPRSCQDLKKYFPGQRDATSATGTSTRRRWLRGRRRRKRRSSLPQSRKRRPSPTLARGWGGTGQGGDQDRERTERQKITLSILMCFSWSKSLYILSWLSIIQRLWIQYAVM